VFGLFNNNYKALNNKTCVLLCNCKIEPIFAKMGPIFVQNMKWFVGEMALRNQTDAGWVIFLQNNLLCNHF
jgi:hypothetical protein